MRKELFPMCSICGGTVWDKISKEIWNRSKDRGRDDHGKIILPSHEWIGNHRATPTTEVEKPSERQPVGTSPYIVFNGIISNDENLGIREGEADTSVLPRVLDTSSLRNFFNSFKKIVGSYAVACLHENGSIWLACNYKPIWIAKKKDRWYFSSLAQHFPSSLHPWKMDPYTVRDLCKDNSSLTIERKQSNKAVIICSSGLDSTTVASYAVSIHGARNVLLLHFNYACRASQKEITQVGKISKYLGTNHKIINITNMNIFGDKSPLMTDRTEISQGISGVEYAHEWVPARNLVMLSLTVAFSEANGFGHIYLGSNLEEAGAYPDNEEQFILDFKNTLYGAVQNGVKIDIHSPLGGLMKHEIIPFGYKYNTPFHLTWSCYYGGDKHCGKCGPCFMRKTAFLRNGLKDPVFE